MGLRHLLHALEGYAPNHSMKSTQTLLTSHPKHRNTCIYAWERDISTRTASHWHSRNAFQVDMTKWQLHVCLCVDTACFPVYPNQRSWTYSIIVVFPEHCNKPVCETCPLSPSFYRGHNYRKDDSLQCKFYMLETKLLISRPSLSSTCFSHRCTVLGNSSVILSVTQAKQTWVPSTQQAQSSSPPYQGFFRMIQVHLGPSQVNSQGTV
jgi:hypothetical protein